MSRGSIDLDEPEDRNTAAVPTTDDSDDDSPIVTALESRARDLSLSIVNPQTLATKLRESLIDIAGPDAAVAYHIGASYDHSTRQVNVQIARVSPSFVALLKSDMRNTSLEMSYQKRTDGGWDVAVGVEITHVGSGWKSPKYGPPKFQPPKGSNVKASFSVTLSR